jgi:hypothetical protein
MYQFILFLHISSLAIGLAAGGILLACLVKLRGATTLEQAAPFGALAGQVEKAFPVAILGLFATGAYMTSDVWTWSTAWIDVGIAALVVLGVQGPLLGGRAGHRLKHILMENGPGPLNAEARHAARHVHLWWAELANFGLVFGIIWNMTHKDGWTEAIAAAVIGYAVGAVLAVAISRAPAPAPDAEAAPAPEAA